MTKRPDMRETEAWLVRNQNPEKIADSRGNFSASAIKTFNIYFDDIACQV